MGRIWRGLKLGMKSLLLHKLRSGLTVLGIVFGVAAVISMLAIAEGTSRDAQEQIRALGPPTSSSARSSPAMRPWPRRPAGPPAILNYGLKYATTTGWSRRSPPSARSCPSGRSASRSAAAPTPSRAAWSGPPHEYADFNLLQIEKGRFLTAADNENYQNYAVLAAETAEKLFPYEDPRGQSVKLGTDYYTVVGVTAERASSAGIGGSLAAQDFNKDVYIPLNTCKLRFGERIVDNRSGSQQAEETQLTQITLQVHAIADVEPTVPLVQASYEKFHPKNTCR